jgi:hypothetical protein
MESFSKLVSAYRGNLMANISLAMYGDTMPFHGKVLLHKVEKHYATGNIRSMAIYVAMFLAEYYREDLPSRVVDLCKTAGLKRKERKVGYPHADGTYHWFGDK